MKVAIYTRVSSDRQAQEGFSLEAQHDRLLEYIKMNQWDLVRIYTDPGISGKNIKDRPGISEMLEDLKANKFDAVLIHKLDRLTRNIGDLHDLIELFNKKSIKLISFSENIDTSTPGGRMFVYFLGVFAQMYRENLAEEVVKGLTKRAEKGLRVNFKPAYGYDVVDQKLIVNEEQARVVKMIFDFFLFKKWGKHKISDYLNEHGYQSNYGRWYDRTVNYVLENPTYIGKNHYTPKGNAENIIITDGDHEPIISEDIFNQVQTQIKRRYNKEMSRSSHEYPFSTILRCGHCGNPFHGKHVVNKNKDRYRNYRCYGKVKHGDCKLPDLSELKIVKMLFEEELPKLTFTISEESYEKTQPENTAKEHEKERKRLEREITKSETRRKNWQYAFGDGKLPYDDFVKLMDEEMIRSKEIHEQYNNLGPEPVENRGSLEDAVEWLNQLIATWDTMEIMDRKFAVQSLFKEIELKHDGKRWYISNIEFLYN